MQIDPIQNYEQAKVLFGTCRSPDKGKPLLSKWRLFKEGDNYVISIPQYNPWVNGQKPEIEYLPLCEIDPDHTLTFVMPHSKLLCNSNSISTVLQKLTSITYERAGKDRYRVGGYFATKARWGGMYNIMHKGSPEYFNGIQFNLLTRECLNPQPDMMETIISEERTQWLRDLRRYKKGLKARAKVGALQGHIEEVTKELAEAKNRWRYVGNCPTWTDPVWAEKLIKSMREEDYSHEILKAFVQSALRIRSNTLDDKSVLRAVDYVFTSNSVYLRKVYGVFGERPHEKT